jgi:hypothetical protein
MSHRVAARITRATKCAEGSPLNLPNIERGAAVMGFGGILSHLLGAARRAVGRVLLTFFLSLILTVIVVEVVGFSVSGGHFALLTHIAAAIVGVVLAYAIGLTVLVGEVIHGLVSSVETVEKDVRSEMGSAGKLAEGVIQGVEQRIERK